jgi:tetratricopeptide (TPR) repeat protein
MPPNQRHDIDALEAALTRESDSERLRERVLEAYAAEDLWLDARRLEHIRWFIRNRPSNPLCRTPLMSVDPEAAPAAYAELKGEWLTTLGATSDDVLIMRGAASFVAVEDLEAATAILRKAVALSPADPELWIDLGRMSPVPAERLSHFGKARSLGSTHPNLLAWIALTAAQAGDDVTAEATAAELLALVRSAFEQHGERLDWPQKGRALWTRARANCDDDEAAHDLVFAISDHAYRKHWAHTVMGLVACHRGDLDGAVAHLLTSFEVRPDHRLSAYGPSTALLHQICSEGRWRDAASCLRVAEKRWNDVRLRTWLAQVERENLPEWS